MRVIHFSSMTNGGAGIAAVRYHRLMQEMGIDSTLYVKTNTIEDDNSIIKLECENKSQKKEIIKSKFIKIIKRIITGMTYVDETKYMYCYYNYSECNERGMIPNLISKIDCNKIDYIFIHWLSGFINSYDIKRLYDTTGAKVIFSMMDLEAITGGCHFPWDCRGYETNCLNCPALSNSMNIISHNQLMTKAANYSYINAGIFSSSLYDLSCAKKSIIRFKNFYQLYYPVDENIFIPAISKTQSDETTLFSNVVSPDEPRKGYGYLLAILLNLDKRLTKKIRFLCLSSKKYSEYKLKNIRFEEFSFCKNVNDLVSLYQQTDVFLCTSIEDSAPMMLQEALLCGIPAVSFDTGIGKQLIEEGKQGYVVPRYDINAFEDKLLQMIEDRPITIQSAEEIHNHMVKICGKETVKQQLKEILYCNNNC